MKKKVLSLSLSDHEYPLGSLCEPNNIVYIFKEEIFKPFIDFCITCPSDSDFFDYNLYENKFSKKQLKWLDYENLMFRNCDKKKFQLFLVNNVLKSSYVCFLVFLECTNSKELKNILTPYRFLHKLNRDLSAEEKFCQNQFIGMLWQLNINDQGFIAMLKEESWFSYDDHLLTHCGACARYICNDFEERFEKIKGIPYANKDLYENIWELYNFVQYLVELKQFLSRNYCKFESRSWLLSKDFNKTIYNFLVIYQNIFEPQSGFSIIYSDYESDISRLNQYCHRYCSDILHHILQLPCFSAMDEGLDFNNPSNFNKHTNSRFEKLL
ncbi:hypothetical protein DID76_00795 [Candidatus Marinamargulisbacteria bacterium SCGC AG-414-C22]|nr:hypothetical protein DID76_00795 [Candidatus Marinamargulisbacteria bacterium SCGC AG-414-C22]